MSVNAEMKENRNRSFVVPCAYLGNKYAKYELFPKKMADYPAIFFGNYIESAFFLHFRIKARKLRLIHWLFFHPALLLHN